MQLTADKAREITNNSCLLNIEDAITKQVIEAAERGDSSTKIVCEFEATLVEKMLKEAGYKVDSIVEEDHTIQPDTSSQEKKPTSTIFLISW